MSASLNVRFAPQAVVPEEVVERYRYRGQVSEGSRDRKRQQPFRPRPRLSMTERILQGTKNGIRLLSTASSLVSIVAASGILFVVKREF
jgi:hypothetical protein